MKINVFLSDERWNYQRNDNGIEHHVKGLYKNIFHDEKINFFPNKKTSGLLFDGLKYYTKIIGNSINILTPGYPIISGFVAIVFGNKPLLLVHTWKVPGSSDGRLSALFYDYILELVIKNSKVTIVASMYQKRQLDSMNLGCIVLFSPVTVDLNYWVPDENKNNIIRDKLGIVKDKYILTVGGNDRNELYGALLAKLLNIDYVRASNDSNALLKAKHILNKNSLLSENVYLIENPNDDSLRALYGGALVVCLPTITKTNPAGLSALVEALSSGGVVAAPEELADGYFIPDEEGLCITDDPAILANKIKEIDINKIRKAARTRALTSLNVENVANLLEQKIKKIFNNSCVQN